MKLCNEEVAFKGSDTFEWSINITSPKPFLSGLFQQVIKLAA